MRGPITLVLCDPDWDLLRRYVDEAGLGHLVASGSEAMEAIAERINSSAPPGPLDFEPLVASIGMVSRIALSLIGPAEMLRLGDLGADEGGLPLACPVCALRRFDWLLAAATQTKRSAAERGLLLPPGLVP